MLNLVNLRQKQLFGLRHEKLITLTPPLGNIGRYKS